MQHLFQAWESFSSAIHEAAHLLLLSDYDGTLTPIVGHPDDARLAPEVMEKLSALAESPAFSVGIISGRSLRELRDMVGIAGIYYAGNHGFEIEGPGLNYVNTAAEAARGVLKDLARQLATGLEGIDGVVIQDKGLSLSVHYRLVKETEEKRTGEIFLRITSPLLHEGKIRTTAGKKVWEVRPPIDWHKGKAVGVISDEIRALLKLEQVLTIYLGDDTTDEDAFRVLHLPEGWGIFVGPENPASGAAYFLDSTAEVAEMLSRLLELK
ncbi:trehalose-phosphatase [Chloroflexota bacterium]